MSLKERVIVVTGGASGIGLALTRHLAVAGACVIIADIALAEQRAAEFAEAGLEATGIAVDVSDEASVQHMIESAEARYGRLDALVNNAGIYSSLEPKPFEQLTVAEWRQLMDVNVIGLFACCKASMPAFRRSGGGSIVNISSAVAFKGNPLMAHYVASKGAVIALTRALASECGAHGVRVNSVAPGFTLSDNVKQNQVLIEGVKGPSLKGRVLARDMLPEDLAGAVEFLVGDGAGFITGQTLVVDGGAYFH